MSFSWVLLSAFIVGLVGSGHCLGMCGGIAAAFSPALSKHESRFSFIPVLTFNAGRISSYALAGSLAGALSFVLGNNLDMEFWTEATRLFTGFIFAMIGLGLLVRWSWPHYLERLGKPIWQRLVPLTHSLQPLVSLKRWFLLGMLWGWIPCGMVYSILLVALMSGKPGYGALTMVFFGLGTLPSMLLSGVLFARLGQWGYQHAIKRYAGVACLIFGVWIAFAPYLPLPDIQQHPLSANSAVCINDAMQSEKMLLAAD